MCEIKYVTCAPKDDPGHNDDVSYVCHEFVLTALMLLTSSHLLSAERPHVTNFVLLTKYHEFLPTALALLTSPHFVLLTKYHELVPPSEAHVQLHAQACRAGDRAAGDGRRPGLGFGAAAQARLAVQMAPNPLIAVAGPIWALKAHRQAN